MALYFIDGKENLREWHVGDSFSPLLTQFWVESIQADGHELEWIFENFPNLKKENSRRVEIFAGNSLNQIMELARSLK